MAGNKLTFELGLDGSGFANGLMTAKEQISTWSANFSTSFAGTAGVAGEKSGGNFLKRFSAQFAKNSGAMSQLISVVSNTMSSLGSGMNPARVLAQQLPNVIQALVSVAGGAMSKIVAVLFNPATWVAGAATAIGAVFFFIGKRMKDSAESVYQFGKSFGDARGPLEKVAELLRDAADKTEKMSQNAKNFRDWMSEVNAPKTDTDIAREKLSKESGSSREKMEAQYKKEFQFKKQSAILGAAIANEELTVAINKEKTNKNTYENLIKDMQRLDKLLDTSEAKSLDQKRADLERIIAETQQFGPDTYMLKGGPKSKSSLLADLNKELQDVLNKEFSNTTLGQILSAKEQLISQTKFSESESLESKVQQAKSSERVKSFQSDAERYKAFLDSLGTGVPSGKGTRSDSLVAVGNLLGSNTGANAMQQISKQQLKQMEKTNTHLGNIYQKLGPQGTIGVPSNN